MTNTSTAADRGAPRGPASRDNNKGMFAKIALFVRQVITEIRKVVPPTRDQLVDYTVVVVAFLVVVMAYIVGLDQVFSRLVKWTFGG